MHLISNPKRHEWVLGAPGSISGVPGRPFGRPSGFQESQKLQLQLIPVSSIKPHVVRVGCCREHFGVLHGVNKI
jgi:hypothetical protein